MWLLADHAAAAAPEAPDPWYVRLLEDYGGWAVLGLAVLAFFRWGLPKILDGWATMRKDFKESLTDTTTKFTGALKERSEQAAKERQEQREAFGAQRALDREAQKEGTIATQQSAIASARLADSMDRFGDKLDALPDRIRRATVTKSPPTNDELTAAREAKEAQENTA